MGRHDDDLIAEYGELYVAELMAAYVDRVDFEARMIANAVAELIQPQATAGGATGGAREVAAPELLRRAGVAIGKPT